MTDPISEPASGNRRSPKTTDASSRNTTGRTTDDVWVYRIALAGVSAALVAFMIGAAIIAAGGNPLPTQYSSVGSGLAGGLLGILAPTPTTGPTTNGTGIDERRGKIKPHLEAFANDVWNNGVVVMLLALFIVSVIFAARNNSPELDTLAAAAGGSLLGLLAPSPGQRGGERLGDGRGATATERASTTGSAPV